MSTANTHETYTRGQEYTLLLTPTTLHANANRHADSTASNPDANPGTDLNANLDYYGDPLPNTNRVSTCITDHRVGAQVWGGATSRH